MSRYFEQLLKYLKIFKRTKFMGSDVYGNCYYEEGLFQNMN
jgi:hypothetical protein